MATVHVHPINELAEWCQGRKDRAVEENLHATWCETVHPIIIKRNEISSASLCTGPATESHSRHRARLCRREGG